MTTQSQCPWCHPHERTAPDDPGVRVLTIRLRGGFWARADAFGISAALRHYGWDEYARQVEDQIPAPVDGSGVAS